MHSNKNQIKNNISKNTSYEADYILFLLVSCLITISIVFSYSLTIYTVEYYGYNKFHFFIRQLFVGTLSILIMWILSMFEPDKVINKIGMVFFVLFFVLMAIMPLLPSSMVTASGGANRWIRLPGFSLSPVEFFKIGFIYFLSWSFHRRLIEVPRKIGLKQEMVLLSPYFLAFFVVVFIIAFLQKDLGQVVLLGGIFFILLIFANRSYKVFVSLGVVGILAFVGLILAAPHRIQRIFSWWAMVQDKILSILPAWADNYLRIEELPEPYQVSHSLNAMHNGGVFGQGIGLGDIKLGFLSEVHTDFVLAGITEEIGLIGLIVITSLMFFIVLRIFRISGRVENKIYHLFTIGIALMIIIAFLINSYGISGMIPIKGIAVPFLSYGGSSMLSMAIAIGLVLSISKSVDLKEKVVNKK